MLSFLKKIKDVLLATFIVIIAILIFSRGKVYKQNELDFGLTFSLKQARDLGLDWQKVYLELLDDLSVKKLRLPAYWEEIEKSPGELNWRDLDWQLGEARGSGAKVILAIGGRLPRWPECHFPDWVKNLSKDKREQATLKYLQAVVSRYRSNREVTAWQVENEPFLSSYFGECPKVDRDFLDREIALVKRLDARPVVITDSGELSLWAEAAGRADIFGTTMYRDSYSGKLKTYIHYPIQPGFFRLKKRLVSLVAKPKDWLVIELQAEPWGDKPYQDLTEAERDRTFSFQKFVDIIDFARKTGFRQFYLWGVEWWYWEKEKNNRPEFWNLARILLNKS